MHLGYEKIKYCNIRLLIFINNAYYIRVLHDVLVFFIYKVQQTVLRRSCSFKENLPQ